MPRDGITTIPTGVDFSRYDRATVQGNLREELGLAADTLLVGTVAILRAKKALAEMQPGQVLHVLATDPGSSKDFAAFARQTGNELVSQADLPDKAFEFFLRRK